MSNVLLLHEFFARAVSRGRGRVAVDVPPTDGRTSRSVVTYDELDRWSNAIARRIQPLIAGESVVAILLPRTAAVFAAQLAALKAGAAYACIDPAFPDERARAIVEDSGPLALLTDQAGAARARRAQWPVQIVIVDDVPPAAGDPDEPIARPSWLEPASLAYLIYTSGTTGQPKGVAVEHRSIANLVASDMAEFGLTPDARVGQSSSTAYDSSIEEVWLAWAVGATVVVIGEETARLGPDLVAWLRRERITVLCPPPTLLRTMGCDDPQRALPDLTLLYVGGEALPRDVADRWSRGRRMVNGYGPTECAVTAVRGDVVEGLPVPIGRAVPGVSAWILNDALDEVAGDEHGELYLGGIGLARGYWHQPELTADRFLIHPRLGRLYRTGDVAHRDSSGTVFCHGRVDSQVKIRGYRIELEEIESCLASCRGVREAACAAQPIGVDTALCAFIVSEDPEHPPTTDELRSALRGALPSYMVPSRFQFVSELPVTVGGKLNRAALPTVAAPRTSDGGAPPATRMEIKLEAAVRAVLHLPHRAATTDDFFNDLGGDSLAAAQLVTGLREDPDTSWVAVRDVYEARTIAELARRSPGTNASPEPASQPAWQDRDTRVGLATMCQVAWLLSAQIVGSAALYLLAFQLLPWLAARLSLTACILLAPVFGAAALAIYTPLSVFAAVTTKRLLIGEYRAMRAPVWGDFYIRHWIVVKTAALVPWRLLEGTIWQAVALRALGARVGRRVHVQPGVDLASGGWDLLSIGDDVTIGQDVTIGLVDLERGDIVVGPVSIGDGATLDARSGVTGDTVIEPLAHLTALSSLAQGGVIPRGERWDGVPARPAGLSAPPPALDENAREWSPAAHAALLSAARAGVALFAIAPLALLAIAACRLSRIDATRLWRWVASPSSHGTVLAVGVGLLCASVPLTLAMQALTMRLVGRVRPGVISRWDPTYVRIWIKTQILQSAGDWLSGTLFWPAWLRAAGMTVGARCEISSIIDVVADLITIGPDVFLADGIYLGGPRVHRGTVTTAATSLSARTFLGNHVIVPAGQHLPADILIGVCTVADARTVRAGSSWFGHPPFELPRPEKPPADRRLTHEPTAIRYANRVFWELLRFALPAAPALVIVTWLRILAVAGTRLSPLAMALVAAPLAGMAAATALCTLVLLLKWLLLGRVRPGEHPLWSCWCSRWDFLYVAWGRYAGPILSTLEGTLLLAWYLRAMGMTLGRRLVLGRGFAQVVDPDMITIEDDAAVSANFQAHTFEDRVLKIDRIRIRRGSTLAAGTVPLYGADIGEDVYVAPHSVIMKHEHLTSGQRYAGVPTRNQTDRNRDMLSAQAHARSRQA